MGGSVVESTEDHVTKEALARTNLTVYRSGSVMVVFRSGVLRHTFPVATMDQPFTVNQDMKVLATRDEVDDRFAFHLLRCMGPLILQRATKVGTTVESVDTASFKSLSVGVPDLAEQRRIADVLDTVDAAIRETDAVITKQEQVKTGLLQDLLTRGLDAEGRLRDPDANPAAFRETEEYGLVPNAWRVTHLINVVPRADYGISASLGYGRETPVLRMNNLEDGEVVLDDLKGSDSAKAHELLLQPKDVLFNRTNSAEHVGRTAIWRGQQQPMSFASYLVRLVPDADSLHPEYLNLWLNWPQTQQRIRQFATPGVSQVNINPTNLRKTRIALPKSMEEQERIVERVNQQRNHMDSEKGYRAKLQRLKTGLMQDLLTGRVRVPEVEERVNDLLA
jgi:type I restriction enzyme S subunit